MERKIKRRSFLKGSTASLGALVLGTTAPYYFQRNIAKAQESGDDQGRHPALVERHDRHHRDVASQR